MSKTKHTEGELSQVKHLLKPFDHCLHIKGEAICIMPLNGNDEANSARLVKCWNMHDELIEMIRTLRMSIYHYREAGTLIRMTEKGEDDLKNIMDESLKLLNQSEQ